MIDFTKVCHAAEVRQPQPEPAGLLSRMLAPLPFFVLAYVVLGATVSAVLFCAYGNEPSTSATGAVPVWANALGLLSLCATLLGSAVSGNFRCATNGFGALIASNVMAFTVTLVAQDDGPSGPIVHAVRTLTPWLSTALLVGMALAVMFLLDAGEAPLQELDSDAGEGQAACE